VLTHKWNGYILFKNKKNGKFLLNCSADAQYHCKKPNDPDRDKPPVEGPPPPDVEG
jgi:hypothetical protein